MGEAEKSMRQRNFEATGRHDPPVGIEAHMPHDSGRPDLFVGRNGNFHFPCDTCAHNTAPESYCEGCRHYCL